MEYYQKAAEKIRSGEEYPINLLKSAGLTALGGGAAAAGSKALTKILPAVGALINQYVPDNMSQAGLNKVDPRFGKFIDGAMKEGYSYDDVRSFLGEKLSKSQAQDQRNIIEQYDPELHSYLKQKIKSGTSLLEAGKQALKHGRFKKAIEKITKDHKTPWTSILQSVFGSGESQTMNPTQEQIQPQQQQAQASQQAQPGQGQQALMAILQKINSRLGQ